MSEISHLYIHVPFCASRCGYCDFYSQAGRLGDAPAYVDAVLAELEAAAGEFGDGLNRVETIYVGGGTPTLLGAGLLGRLLAGVRARLAAVSSQPEGARARLAAVSSQPEGAQARLAGVSSQLEGAQARLAGGSEVTVEANPATVTAELAPALREAGVTRVSLGAQSFSPRLRRRLERQGPVEAIAGAVAMLRDAGFDNIGLDLVFGIPGQELTELQDDLRRALALAPEHISCYELTVKEGSPYARRWGAELAAADRGRLFYEKVVDTLEGAGYRWYETSNFAHPGFECRHNLAYWDGADYLGLGAGAWSTVGRRRWRNVEDVGRYIGGVAAGNRQGIREIENLTASDKTKELLILGLRKVEGIPWMLVDSTIDKGKVLKLKKDGLLANDNKVIRLTKNGRFVSNEITVRLLGS